MTNVDRIIASITTHGADNVLIHSIPGTRLWLVCQKIEDDKWAISLGEPMKNVIYNLGIVSTGQHLNLWRQLANREIDNKAKHISTQKMAANLREIVRNFTSKYKTYGNFLRKTRQITRRTKKSTQRRTQQLLHKAKLRN